MAKYTDRVIGIDNNRYFVIVWVMPPISFGQLARVKKYLHRRSLIALIILAVLVAGLGSVLKKAPEVGRASTIRSVEVKSVTELSSQNSLFSVVGTVSSVSEATVRAEVSGQVTRVNRSLGDSVAAGSIIVELEAASQRAALQQAKGAVDAAKAALAKVQAGTRPEQLAILQSNLEAAKSGAVNTLLSSYAAIDNAIKGGADAMFNNPEETVPSLKFTVPDSQLTADIQNGRVALSAMLKRHAALSPSLSVSSDFTVELPRAESDLRTVRDFLDDMIAGLNRAVPNASVSAATISSFQATASGARTSINAALSAVSGARQALQAAQKNAEQGVTGAQQEDVDAARAAVTQAEGAYAAALANLEKAIIRAPISGTINSLSIKRGDYVQATTPVVTVANNGALEIVAYVTEQDMRDIRPGNSVTLEDDARGIVTRVAPALDPLTKKVEVRIGVAGSPETLVNGQSVSVTFARSGAPVVSTAARPSRIAIPISAVKMGAKDASVFTVAPDSTLIAHPVALGELLGDRVVVVEGLSLDMMIVTDARGLRAGQTVSVE